MNREKRRLRRKARKKSATKYYKSLTSFESLSSKLEPIPFDLNKPFDIQDQRDMEEDMIDLMDEMEGEELRHWQTIKQYRSEGFDTPPEEWAVTLTPEEIARVRSDKSLRFYPVGRNAKDVSG